MRERAKDRFLPFRGPLRLACLQGWGIPGFIYFSTFFGGSTADWAATKDEYTYFDDFVVSTGPISH